MPGRVRRHIALVLLTLLAFAQINVALAGCLMERGSMAQMAAVSGDDPCVGCNPPVSDTPDQISNLCVVHCTSDLQVTAQSEVVVLGAIDIPLFLLPRLELRPPARSVLGGPPVAAPPRRILLHSFLI
jgi:hypothetical protein